MAVRLVRTPPAHVFKVIIVGNVGVGKTCLQLRATNTSWMPTHGCVGIDFKNMSLVVDGLEVRLQVWDTAGQERFLGMGKRFFQDWHAALMVYDITDRESFEDLHAWRDRVMSSGSVEDAFVAVVASKLDRADHASVTTAEAQALCRRWELPLFATSSKRSQGVHELFRATAVHLVDRVLPNKRWSAMRKAWCTVVARGMRRTGTRPSKCTLQ